MVYWSTDRAPLPYYLIKEEFRIQGAHLNSKFILNLKMNSESQIEFASKQPNTWPARSNISKHTTRIPMFVIVQKPILPQCSCHQMQRFHTSSSGVNLTKTSTKEQTITAILATVPNCHWMCLNISRGQEGQRKALTDMLVIVPNCL